MKPKGTPRRYVALLRAISQAQMEPYRKAMEELGLTDVDSFGMSGNLMFNARGWNKETIERRITSRLGTTAIVRTRAELATILAADPFGARRGAAVFFLVRPPTAARRRALLQLDFAEPRPVLRGAALFHVWPTTLHGRKTPVNFEKILGVRGTDRTSRVVAGILARMTGSTERGLR